MLKLLKNVHLFSPQDQGVVHILIAQQKIAWIGSDVPKLDPTLEVEEDDLDGMRVAPGLIDGHAHLTGGGGESGYSSRVPALCLSEISAHGVTTVVGVLGTDDVTRTTGDLVAQAMGMREQGLSAYCHCGGYHYPIATLTGSIRSDIVYIEPIIGVGELALSDHRSSQLTLDEFLRVASEAHVAGMMTGKAGIVHCHMGDGERGLDLINRALDVSEIPARVFNPTHINRNTELFKQGLELMQRGSTVDITAYPQADDDPGFAAAEALERCLRLGDASKYVTVSSDGGGCLPEFDSEGQIVTMEVGHSDALHATIYQLLEEGHALSQILPAFTSNVADLLRLENKGRLVQGKDADLVVFNDQHQVWGVMALGEWHKLNNEQRILGTFESKK